MSEVRILLTLSTCSEPIEGSIDGARRFEGWLELVTELERLRAEARHDDPGDEGRAGTGT